MSFWTWLRDKPVTSARKRSTRWVAASRGTLRTRAGRDRRQRGGSVARPAEVVAASTSDVVDGAASVPCPASATAPGDERRRSAAGSGA